MLLRYFIPLKISSNLRYLFTEAINTLPLRVLPSWSRKKTTQNVPFSLSMNSEPDQFKGEKYANLFIYIILIIIISSYRRSLFL